MVKPRPLCLALSLVTLTFAAPVQALALRSNTIACVTEEYLDEAVTYSVAGDNKGLMALMVTGACTIIQAGSDVSVISQGMFMGATIRYNGTKLYTIKEAVSARR